MDRNPACVCGVIAAVIVVVGLYLYLSFDVLDPTQAGLDFNRITYKLGRLEDRGRHWLGLGHYFIKFPLTNELIEFSGDSQLRSRTSDGLEVLLEVSLQFKLNYTRIPEVYQKFGPNYVRAYELFTMDTINKEATSFNASTFFNQRTTVQEGFATKLADVYSNEGFCILSKFQLRTVSLPDQFETAIQTTEVQNQDILLADAELEYQKVVGETTLLVAHQTALATIQAAEADAATITLNVDATIAAFNISQGLASTEFAKVADALGNNQAALLEYMKVRALFTHPDTHSIVNIKLPGAAAVAPPIGAEALAKQEI